MARKKKVLVDNLEQNKIVTNSEELQPYTQADFAKAVYDLSVELNNPYFRAPFKRCPNCDNADETVMAHFGAGGSNKIGNLRGFQATIGDVIAWSSAAFKGLSVVKAKHNGIFELETEHFDVRRDEPALIEKMTIPQKYRALIGEMATFLTNKDANVFKGVETVNIGESGYPIAIKEKL